MRCKLDPARPKSHMHHVHLIQYLQMDVSNGAKPNPVDASVQQPIWFVLLIEKLVSKMEAASPINIVNRSFA